MAVCVASNAEHSVLSAHTCYHSMLGISHTKILRQTLSGLNDCMSWSSLRHATPHLTLKEKDFSHHALTRVVYMCGVAHSRML